MTDPLSIATGVAGVIQLAGLVIGQCYRYGCGVSSAPDEARRLVAEVTSVSGVLVGVQGAVKHGDPSGYQFDGLLQELRSLLQKLSTKLQKDSPDAGLSKGRRTLNRLLWPLRKGETEELVSALERHKNSFSLGLNSISVDMLIDHTTLLDNIADSVSDLSADFRTNQALQERREILDWLSDHQYDAQYRRGCQLHCLDTCTWLLHEPEFQSWMQKRSSLLWMHGQAGSGKTVATSYIINHLSIQSDMQAVRLAYFYYDASTIESLTPQTFFGTIVKQFCAGPGEIPNDISDAYQRAVGRAGTPKQPESKELERFLKLFLEDQSPSIIVIDGLDESPDYGIVCDFLTDCISSGKYPLRVFISSRPEVDLQRRLEPFQEIPVPEDAIENDIGAYIKMRIDSDARLTRMSPKMKVYVEQTLRKDSHAMFRWVQCQLDAISSLRTDAAVKKALKSLPSSLEGSYSRILQNIDLADVDFARRTLLWLAYAVNPLTLPELSQAVVLDSNFDWLDPDATLNDPKDVLEICGSLVSFNTVSETARIAHHSVREYLTDRLSPTSEFSIPAATSHKYIAEVCISYLLLEDFESGPLILGELKWTLENYPLLRYAAQNWPFHVQLSGAEKELQPLILRLMTPQPNENFLFWLQVVLFDSKHGYIPPKSELTSARALYYATSYGLIETVRSLIAMGANLDERAGRFGGAALHAAVWRRRPGILRMLIDAGADVKLRDYNGSTAPDLALWGGSTDLFDMFVDKLNMDTGLARLMQKVLTKRSKALSLTAEEWHIAQKFQDQDRDEDQQGELMKVVNRIYKGAVENVAVASTGQAVQSTVPRTNIADARVVGEGQRFELD
ncbi:hypothetical protein LTR84_005597 [Exophiala bonariae]|uniref:NACHT domain-containing protein n=1 Tax=Exophiala bonariae TaxID=1690606 RepID=A0AAV9N6A2_9EURO|nr:hypothetical protein LTR84_005597 [Exophiala bonariae]